MSLADGSGGLSSAVGSLAPEEVDMLRDAFIYMDRDNDGHVGRDELLATVRRCVGDARFEPLREYLIPLFAVADRDRDGRLSLAEFLLSFANGPGVVPAEVINSCVSSIRVRLTDEEIATLQDTFRRIDTKADGYIDKEELVAALKENLKYRFPDLRENNYNDIVAVIMASADTDRDGRLCLSEFIRSFQEDQGVLPAAFVDAHARQMVQQMTPAEIEVLKQAFAVLDKNKDGFVEFSDIYESLWETLSENVLDKSQVHELCDLIMVTADRSKSGILTLADFVRGFVQNITLTQLPVASAQEKLRTACNKLQEMLESGELEQLSVVQDDEDGGSGCVSPNHLIAVLNDVFRDVFPSLDEELLSAVMGAIVVASDNDNDKKISMDDFIHCFAEGPRVLSVDSSSLYQSTSVTDGELLIVSQILQDLGKEADSEGYVHEPELLEAVRAAFGADPSQADRVLQYVRDNIVKRNSCSSLVVETSVECSRPDMEYSAMSNVLKTDELQEANTKQQTKVGDDEEEGEPQEQKEEESKKDQQKINPSPHSPGELYQTQPANYGSALLKTVTPPKSLKVHEFGTNATVSDVLLKQHTRRYLESVYDTADRAVFDDELRVEFKKYANDNQDFIDREKFIKEYLAMEHYGLPLTETEVNRIISRYSKSEKISYNEFCVIMLQRARM
ncbi:putative calmodulin [Trypanosoma theileri]|uniref:Putative calmodulin n=1 Tax=Trypanosoma theileri TaxID=67003 RepID=A0A1X0P1B1_9TRYP|nr:putative calmodulin [Trypanosoma theileri]ORC90717.1 putative calmodulin [Trypanosoma theileri]